MKKVILIALIAFAINATAQKNIGVNELRFYVGVNKSTPKENLSRYKGTFDIEAAIGLVSRYINYRKNLALGIEPMIKLKRYTLDAITSFYNIEYDYSISGIEYGARLYPFKSKSISKKSGILVALGNILYTDIFYSSLKFVKNDVPVDVKRKMLSWGLGLSSPIYEFNDIGINSTLIASIGFTNYRWTNSANTKTSFSAISASLAFALVREALKNNNCQFYSINLQNNNRHEKNNPITNNFICSN